MSKPEYQPYDSAGNKYGELREYTPEQREAFYEQWCNDPNGGPDIAAWVKAREASSNGDGSGSAKGHAAQSGEAGDTPRANNYKVPPDHSLRNDQNYKAQSGKPQPNKNIKVNADGTISPEDPTKPSHIELPQPNKDCPMCLILKGHGSAEGTLCQEHQAFVDSGASVGSGVVEGEKNTPSKSLTRHCARCGMTWVAPAERLMALVLEHECPSPAQTDKGSEERIVDLLDDLGVPIEESNYAFRQVRDLIAAETEKSYMEGFQAGRAAFNEDYELGIH